MRTLWFAILGLGWLGSGQAAEPARADFAYSMPLNVDGAAPMYELALPAEVYERTVSQRLADVRVLNGHGEVLPYAIERHVDPALATPQGPVSVPFFPLQGSAAVGSSELALSIRTESGDFNLQAKRGPAGEESLRGYLVDLRRQTRALNALELQWPEDTPEFSENVTVQASDDLRQWRVIATAPLVNLRFNGQALKQQRIEFPVTEAKYVRVLWREDHERATINGIGAVFTADRRPLSRSERALPGRSAAGHPFEFEVDVGAQLPVDRINVRLPERNTLAQISLYSRARSADAWREVAAATYYRLARGADPDIANAAITVGEDRDRFWKMVVAPAGGGVGSGMPELVVGWVPDTVRFVARGAGPYELVFGNAVAASAEVALSGVATAVQAGQTALRAATATTGSMVEVGGPTKLVPPPPPRPWKTWLLWAVLCAGVGVLGYFAWKLTRELADQGQNPS
jgi:hypothetical protein